MKVCLWNFFPCVYDSVNYTISLNTSLPCFPTTPKKKKPQNRQNSTTNTNKQNPQSLPIWIKKVILKTAPVQLSPYLSMQPREMHVKVLTELAGVIAEILSLKDYGDWKRSLLTGKKQMLHPSWEMMRRTVQGRQSIDLISVLRKIMELVLLELVSGQRKEKMIWNSMDLPAVWLMGLPSVMGWVDLWMRGRTQGGHQPWL